MLWRGDLRVDADLRGGTDLRGDADLRGVRNLRGVSDPQGNDLTPRRFHAELGAASAISTAPRAQTCRPHRATTARSPHIQRIQELRPQAGSISANVDPMLDPFHSQGVARTSTLLRQGWSRHAITVALNDGRFIRPRKGWVATPDADQGLLHAARHGLLLSCITQAKRLGLWVRSEQEWHFAARASGLRDRPSGVVHWRTPLVPRDPDALEDPIENVLDVVARCQPFEEAVAIWDSALNRGLVEWRSLSRLRFTGAARQVLAASSRYADSGLESYVRTRLAWFRIRVIPQAWVHGHRVDFLIGDRLILQVDGRQHTGPQRTTDNQHDAQVRLLGYEVIRVTYAQVMHDWPATQWLIMEAIAQGKHLAA